MVAAAKALRVAGLPASAAGVSAQQACSAAAISSSLTAAGLLAALLGEQCSWSAPYRLAGAAWVHQCSC